MTTKCRDAKKRISNYFGEKILNMKMKLAVVYNAYDITIA